MQDGLEQRREAASKLSVAMATLKRSAKDAADKIAALEAQQQEAISSGNIDEAASINESIVALTVKKQAAKEKFERCEKEALEHECALEQGQQRIAKVELEAKLLQQQQVCVCVCGRSRKNGRHVKFLNHQSLMKRNTSGLNAPSLLKLTSLDS